MEHLPTEIAKAIQNGMEENEIIKLAKELLEQGEKEQASLVLDYCF
ncbi:hypothetical protein [Marinifilum caeruleilacunae]|nr:hypothetical protein [Marinifilum caeruleilacunae]